MAEVSAGILLYRHRPRGIEVLIAHPGGPFWSRRDSGIWSIPKGHVDEGEGLLDAARREFAEETGQAASGPYIELGEVRLRSRKRVIAYASEGDFDPGRLSSATFELEWPRGSGVVRVYPEVDRVAWCDPPMARVKLNRRQATFVDRLLAVLSLNGR